MATAAKRDKSGELLRWIHRRWQGKVRVRRDPVKDFAVFVDNDLPDTSDQIIDELHQAMERLDRGEVLRWP